MSDATTNTLLNQILGQIGDMREDIGGINSQLEAGAQKHKSFEQTLDMLDRRTDIIEDKIVVVENVLIPSDGTKPLTSRIKSLELFIGRQSIIIGAATSIIVGALTLIGWAISAFKEDILKLFRH